MTKYSILLLSLLLSLPSQAQVRIVDATTGTSIPFAHLISADGTLVCTSDSNGEIAAKDLAAHASDNTDTLVVQHISYQNAKTTAADLLASKKLALEPRTYSLNEVVISNAEPDYLVLKGYFRCYCFDDSIPAYFTDGVVEFFFKLGKNGIWDSFNPIEVRTYSNSFVIKKHNRAGLAVIENNGFPIISSKPATVILGAAEERDSAGMLLLKSDEGIATVAENGNKLAINVELRNQFEQKVFGFQSKCIGSYQNKVYLAGSLKDAAISKLASSKQYSKIAFKNKKLKDFVIKDLVEEFYVIDRYFASKREVKAKKPQMFNQLHKSNYSELIDKTMKANNIQGINENIKRQFEKTLKAY